MRFSANPKTDSTSEGSPFVNINMIYKAVWLLLQICFTVYEVLRQICCRSQLALRSYDQRRSKNNEEIFLKKCSSELSKLPNHLSIIIGPEESVLEDELISRIINYALWMKIDFISLYDTRLEKQRCNLEKLKLPKYVRVKELGKRHLLWTIDRSSNGTLNLNNGKTNGYKNGQKNADNFIQVFEVEPFQGHALIADVCRDLFKQRQSNEIQEMLQERTQLSRHIDEELSMRLWKCKDPELCIIFSKYICTYGMLPWQMRFTEFYLHQQENLFDARTFAKILYQYAKCEQRWGK